MEYKPVCTCRDGIECFDCAIGNNPIDKDAFIEFLLDALEMASPIDRERWYQIFKENNDGMG